MLGIEYVETNEKGETKVSTGILPTDRFIHPFLSSIHTFNSTTKQYKYIFPFQGPMGEEVAFTYTILDPFTNGTLLDAISAEERPTLVVVPMKEREFMTLSPLDGNAIHICEPKGACPGFLLPQTGLTKGTYYGISNQGSVPVTAYIPCPTGAIQDCIGPKELLIYSFLGEDAEVGACYSRTSFQSSYLPYDSLQDMPRTSKSVYLKSIDRNVYVREKGKDRFEVLCTHDGYYCPVQKHRDGNVYDIDDTFHTNPLMVTSLGEKPTDQLVYPPNHLRQIRPEKPLLVQQDTTTGLAFLCRQEGVPCINAFGFVKCTQTPLLSLRSGIKLRGSMGDLAITISPVSLEYNPYRVEPFIDFNLLYRSRFVAHTGEKFIFITNDTIPIVSPKGILIEPIGIVDESTTDIRFQEPEEGTIQRHAFRLPSAANSSLPIDTYPIRNLNNLLFQATVMREVLKLQGSYASAIDLANRYSETLQTSITDVKVLGESQTENIQEILRSTRESLSESKKEVLAYEPLLKRFGEGTKIFNQDDKITAEMIGVKLRKTVDTMHELIVTTLETIHLYNEGIKQIKEIEQLLKNLKENSRMRIKEILARIQETGAQEVQRRNETSAPDIEKIFQKGLRLQEEYEKTLLEFESIAAKKPEYVSEIGRWYSTCKKYVGSAETTLEAITQLEEFDLPHTIKAENEERDRKRSNEERQKRDEIHKLLEMVKDVAAWVGDVPSSGETHEMEVALKVQPGEEVVKGLSISMHPFEKYKNPSLKRDWVGAEPDLQEVYNRSVTARIGPIRNKLELILIHPTYKNATQLSGDALEQAYAQLKKDILAYEAELDPVFHALEALEEQMKERQASQAAATDAEQKRLKDELISMKTAAETVLEMRQSILGHDMYTKYKGELNEIDPENQGMLSTYRETAQRIMKELQR